MQLEPLSIAVFLAASSLAAYLIHRFQRMDPRALERMNSLSREENTQSVTTGKGISFQAIPRVLGNTSETPTAKQLLLQSRLAHAGINHAAALSTFLTTKLCLTCAPAVLAAVAFSCRRCDLNLALIYGTVGGAIGMLLPGFWLDRRRTARQNLLTRSVPDFLDLLVACLEAGLSLDAALQRVTAELQVAHRELALEMQRVQQEIDLGTTTEEALKNFAERSGLDSIRTLSSTIQQARRFGSNISDSLRLHADAMRIQREYRAEELAQQAAVKILFPTLLCIFPAVFVILAGPAAIQLYEKFGGKNQQVISEKPLRQSLR